MVEAVLGGARGVTKLVAPKAFIVDALPFCALLCCLYSMVAAHSVNSALSTSMDTWHNVSQSRASGARGDRENEAPAI